VANVLVRASVAPMHAEARVSSVQISQQLAGRPVTVLEAQGDWLRVRGEDDYEGWMHRGYLERSAESATHARRRTLSLGCVVRTREAGATRALPLGAWLAPDETAVLGETIEDDVRASAFPCVHDAIARTAVERFFGPHDAELDLEVPGQTSPVVR